MHHQVAHRFFSRAAAFFSACGLIVLTGCATGPQAHPSDPLEPLNRGIFAVNDGIDQAVLKPVAKAYRAVVPEPVRTGVSNAFRNIQDAWTAVNAVLQLKPQIAVESLVRVGVNSTFGFAGLIDLASEMGIERHTEDLGKTLGRWGVPTGPYLVLPLIGPSSLRDVTDTIAYQQIDPVPKINDAVTRHTVTGLRVVNTRTQLLPITNMLDQAAVDRYSFTRDAYLQRRGARPPEPEDTAESSDGKPKKP